MWRNKRSRVKFKSVAPCGRYTALAQLSLSRTRVYASRLETRDSRAARNWLVAPYGNFPSNQYIPVICCCFFFNATSIVHKQNFRNKKRTSRASLMLICDAVSRKAPILMPETSNAAMHNASRSAQGMGVHLHMDQGHEVSRYFDDRDFRSLKLHLPRVNLSVYDEIINLSCAIRLRTFYF